MKVSNLNIKQVENGQV